MKKVPEDIRELDERIALLQAKEAKLRDRNSKSEFSRASKIGFRIGVEMFSAVIVGAAIGYLLDNLCDSKPWFLVAFMFLGGGAGILNVYRLAKNIEHGD
ncbi:MAG: AtpZ/AtpI family protein [Alphaproteobacteria bacterium]|nr:AtpZ/AtpI family protein [Alphaproteobacteria bacterium]